MTQLSGDPVILTPGSELRKRAAWFIRMRWLAGAALLFGSGLLYLVGFPLPVLYLWIVGITVLAYNLALYFGRDKIHSTQARLTRSIYLQIGLDWGALACTAYFTGGIRSPFSLTFVFHLIIGSFLLSPTACYLLAAGASILVGAMAVVPQASVMLPFEAFFPGFFPGPGQSLWIWGMLTFFFFISTYLSTSITARIRADEIEIARSQEALDHAYRKLESLYELGKVVNSTLDLKEVLSLISENATRLMQVRACFLRLFDKSGKKLCFGGSYGLSQEYINKGPVEVEKSLVDSDVLEKGVIQVLDVVEDGRLQYPEEAIREGLRSMLSCAITAKNHNLGIIRVYTSEPHVFSSRQVSLLLNLANLGAVAIQNAKSYSDLLALDEEREWFARMTHHQVRAPLAAAQGALEAMSFAGTLNETQEDLARRAQKRIQDSIDMIRDLLDLAAAQRIEDTVAVEPIRFDQSLGRALETAREQARSKGLAFDEEIEASNCPLQIKPDDLERIFSNLLNNAVKYTRAGGVRFGAKLTDGWLDAWVEDTGIGIQKEDIEKVFKGFYRTAAAKATGEGGTGLGLSIVRKIIERVGGTLSVESEPGKGTRFDVHLPLFKPTADS